MQGRVKITPLSPMKYAVPGIDPYLMPRVRMGGLVDHVAVRLRGGGAAWVYELGRRGGEQLQYMEGGGASSCSWRSIECSALASLECLHGCRAVPSLRLLPPPVPAPADYPPLSPPDVHRVRHQLPRRRGLPPDGGRAD
jgi:hypothetical protein